MTYKFKDFKVSFKCEALCKWGFMDLGIYIYHFSNIRQLRRHIKAKRAIVHPMNTSQLRNVDFPLTLIGMNTEEFVVEIEVVD